jgi:hypothetical protein
MKCLIYNATQIVQVTSNGEKYLRGNDSKIKDLAILEDESNSLTIVSIE